MVKHTLLFGALALMATGVTLGQLYVAGEATDNEVYVDGTMVGEPALYINGYLQNAGGDIFNDAGEIELTGNWTNTPGVSGSYESTGIERFTGSNNQIVAGTMNGTVGNINQFYNLRVDKSAAGQFVSLQTNTNVNAAGTVNFETYGIIRTDIASHGNNGSLYPYELFVRNTAIGSMIGYATSGNDNYIEGRLRRAVTGAGTYYFPIGVQSTTLDGEEPFNINFTSAPTSNILSYVQPGTINLLGTTMYCDVGTDPSPLTGTTVLANPFSPADGILDQMVTDCQYSVEWVATASVAGPYDYTINVEPGPVLQAECPFYASTWLGELKWTAKDGIPNNAAVGSPAPFLTPGYMTCPNLFTIAGLTSFSVFRVHGITNGAVVILPLELVDLYGETKPEGNMIYWATENETNNDYFVVESSADAQNFQPIGVVDGAGNSNHEIAYNLLDKDPVANTTYYRLKTVDFSGEIAHTEVISLTRQSNQQLNIAPVPALTEVTINFNCDVQATADLSIIGMDGKPVFRKNWSVSNGTNALTVDIANWTPGTYIVQITGAGAPIRAKLIKQ